MQKAFAKDTCLLKKIAIAKKGYDGIIKKFIKEENGQTILHGTVKVSGLGGKPALGSNSWRSQDPCNSDDPIGVTIEFKSVSKLRNFINKNDRVFKIYRP